jgi:hypothetical protein
LAKPFGASLTSEVLVVRDRHVRRSKPQGLVRASTVSAVLNTENDLEIQVVGAREQ